MQLGLKKNKAVVTRCSHLILILWEEEEGQVIMAVVVEMDRWGGSQIYLEAPQHWNNKINLAGKISQIKKRMQTTRTTRVCCSSRSFQSQWRALIVVMGRSSNTTCLCRGVEIVGVLVLWRKTKIIIRETWVKIIYSMKSYSSSNKTNRKIKNSIAL